MSLGHPTSGALLLWLRWHRVESRGDPHLGCLPRWVMEPQPAERMPAPWAAATVVAVPPHLPQLLPAAAAEGGGLFPFGSSAKGPNLRSGQRLDGTARATAGTDSSLRRPSCLLPEGWQPCTTWVSTFTLPQASHSRAPARNNNPEDQQQTSLEHRKHKTERELFGEWEPSNSAFFPETRTGVCRPSLRKASQTSAKAPDRSEAATRSPGTDLPPVPICAEDPSGWPGSTPTAGHCRAKPCAPGLC